MQVGFLPLLTLVFVAAKLFGAITWSWWIVFAPLWAGIPLVILSLVLLAVIMGVLEWWVNK